MYLKNNSKYTPQVIFRHANESPVSITVPEERTSKLAMANSRVNHHVIVIEDRFMSSDWKKNLVPHLPHAARSTNRKSRNLYGEVDFVQKCRLCHDLRGWSQV